MATFAERFSALIHERGWTQQEAADRLGISQALISRYLNGKRVPLPRTVGHIAERLGIGVEVLTGVGDNKSRERTEVMRSQSDKSSHKAMLNLRRRWRTKPKERETIRHLIAALFPGDAAEVLDWLDKPREK